MPNQTPLFVQTGYRAAAIACFWAVLLAWIPASIAMPLARDQGIFAWAGTVILHGGLPYSDAWEVKGPAAHGLYSLALLLFGKHQAAIRLFDVFMWMVAAFAFFRLSQLCTGNYLAGWAALPIALISSGSDYWLTAQPDEWAAIMLLLCVMLVFEPKATRASVISAGSLVGLATLIKPQYLLYGLLFAIAVWTLQKREGRKALTMWFGAGVALPVTIVAAIYALASKLRAAWDVLVEFNLTVHVQRHHFSAYRVQHEAAQLLTTYPSSFFAALALIGFLYLRQSDVPRARLLATATALAFIVVVSQNKFYLYHFMPFHFFIAILAGIGFSAIGDRVRSSMVYAAAGVCSTLLLIVALKSPLEHSLNWWMCFTRRVPPSSYLEEYCQTDFCYRDIAEAATVVDNESKPGEPVYLWGFDALVYFLADRPSVSRFGFNYPMIAGSDTSMKSAREELISTLKVSPPTVILVQRHDSNNLMPLSSDQYLAAFSELRHFLETRYRPVFNNHSFVIYKLIAGSPSVAQADAPISLSIEN